MHTASLQRALRALCLLGIGLLNVCYSQDIAVYIVMATGVLFIVPSLFALISYPRLRKSAPRGVVVVPVVSLGAALFGIVLLAAPAAFVTAFMYVMAGLLIAIGLWQMVNFVQLRRRGMELLGYEFVVSLLTVAAGAVVLAHPFTAAGVPFIIIGAGCLCYALLEFWNAWLQYKYEKTHHVEDITPTAEASDDDATPEAEAEVVEAEVVTPPTDTP